MESKTKYRILGILVIVAIVVIVMPFIHFKKEANRDIASAPPFPEQNAQVSSLVPVQQPMENAIEQKPADTINNPSPTRLADNSAVTNRVDAAVTDPGPSDDQNEPSPVSMNSNLKSNNADTNQTAQALQTAFNSSVQNNTHQNKQAPVKKHQTKTIVKTNAKKPAHITQRNFKLNSQKSNAISIRDNGLYDIKTPVWVIQLGSFQSKESAVRMVNSLRANGYKAFFQEIDTVLGEKTRVFVGPELDQAAARHLAKQLEAELKVRGVVASYKPFAL